MCIGAMVYWAVGFAITFGKSRPGIAYIMGTSYYFFHEMPRELYLLIGIMVHICKALVRLHELFPWPMSAMWWGSRNLIQSFLSHVKPTLMAMKLT